MAIATCLRKLFSTQKKKEDVTPGAGSIKVVRVISQKTDNASKLLGYDGSPTTFTQLIDADPTLSLRHAGFKGKAVDISSLPNWYWREEACQDWVSDFATTYLRMNSWQAREVGERFEGTGRGLYCMHKENWSTILGSEKKGEVIYAFLVKASREKGVVPSGIVIGHQTDLKG